MTKKPRKHGKDLLCKTHGPAGLVIQEREPGFRHRFEIRCRLCGGKYKNWASDRAVEDLLRAYPDCDAREYKSKWDEQLEDPK